jgi:hypothetical protein
MPNANPSATVEKSVFLDGLDGLEGIDGLDGGGGVEEIGEGLLEEYDLVLLGI